eukprot:GILI01043954.1.p1 GENE.GILI01043954.1~~GILI01043954.1.p1  ORF type:complete len:143 (+),score=8.10 GILI01043954.1:26-430(+)
MSNNSVSNTTLIMESAAVYVDCQQGTSLGAILVVIAVDKSTFSIVGNRLRHLRRSPDTGGQFAFVVYFNIAMSLSAEVDNASRLTVDNNSAADIVGVAQGVLWSAVEWRTSHWPLPMTLGFRCLTSVLTDPGLH